MKTPTYTLETIRGKIVYGYDVRFRKWAFWVEAVSLCVLVRCKGKEQGHKVANLIMGSLKRCGGMDNLCTHSCGSHSDSS
jgi:hypothetical protein